MGAGHVAARRMAARAAESGEMRSGWHRPECGGARRRNGQEPHVVAEVAQRAFGHRGYTDAHFVFERPRHWLFDAHGAPEPTEATRVDVSVAHLAAHVAVHRGVVVR